MVTHWSKALGILLLIMLLATVVLLPANPDVMAADSDWSTPQYISHNSHNQGNSQAPRIAVDREGNLYVVWEDSTIGNTGIPGATRSSSGNWSALDPIPGTSTSSENPSLAVDREERLHVAWQDNITGESGIFYANRTSSGDWSVPQRITGSSGNSTAPDIAVDAQGNPHVVWQENQVSEEGPEAPDILYTTKPSDGSWAEPTNISNNTGWSMYPSIAVDSAENVHVVWRDDTGDDTGGGYSDILYATKISDSGWSVPLNISQSERNSSWPRIAVDDENNPHVVWQETSYNANMTVRDIRLQYNTTSGGNWLAKPESILPTSTNETIECYLPDIAVDPTGKPQVVWYDNHLGTSSIGYAIRQAKGAWSYYLSISQSPYVCTNPSIAIDAGGTPHVVWQGSTPQLNTDIFYANKPNANMPNAPPNQPSNISPGDGAPGVSLTPILEASDFSDPDAGDTHAASQWQVTTTSGNYSNPIFNSTSPVNLTRISLSSGYLGYNTTYYWRVSYQDSHDSWSPYSNETSFTTTGTTGETTGHSSWLTGRVIGAIAGGVVVLAVVLWLVFRRRPPAPA